MDTAAPFISMRTVYTDEHLIEIETQAAVKGWAAVARAYTSAEETAEAAKRLSEWISRPAGRFTLEFGADTGIGWTSLGFYTVDKSGHVGCHLRMATRTGQGAREEETSRVSIEMPTEPGLIDSFVHELHALATNRNGEAILRGVLA